MANFIDDCMANGFGWETLLTACFAEEQSLALARTGQLAFRIVEKTADRDTEPIDCNNYATFLELWHQALHTADDGKPALRVVITDRANGASLVDVPVCGNAENIDLLARRTFIYTTDGEVAVNLANIT